MSPEPDRTPIVEIAPALTNVARSKELVSQSLEALFVYLGDDGVHHLRPIHARTLRVGWPADRQPGEIVAAAARRYELAPLLVHSTSWRLENARADLAQGDAMGPPPEIGVSQVLKHAFRHLSWLVEDDEAVRAALPEWVAFLDRYEPEPFRPFGAPPG